MQNPESCAKFQDQAHKMYTDSLHKKHPNGGHYPLTAINGLALPNGHGPLHDQQRMALEDMDNMHHRSQSAGQRNPYSGKLYHHVCWVVFLQVLQRFI